MHCTHIYVLLLVRPIYCYNFNLRYHFVTAHQDHNHPHHAHFDTAQQGGSNQSTPLNLPAPAPYIWREGAVCSALHWGPYGLHSCRGYHTYRAGAVCSACTQCVPYIGGRMVYPLVEVPYRICVLHTATMLMLLCLYHVGGICSFLNHSVL